MKKPKEPGIMRMTAHQYEKKINELLEKIDILESRLLIANTQKGYAVTKLKDYEEKNEELNKKYDEKMKENEKLKETKKENEEEINDLKKSNKIFTQRNKERFADIYPEEIDNLDNYLYLIKKDIVRIWILRYKKRVDGRKLDELRPLGAEVGILPRAHGSAVFSRGHTQVLSAVTLGSFKDRLLVDNLYGE